MMLKDTGKKNMESIEHGTDRYGSAIEISELRHWKSVLNIWGPYG